jgi:hypothetical protein
MDADIQLLGVDENTQLSWPGCERGYSDVMAQVYVYILSCHGLTWARILSCPNPSVHVDTIRHDPGVEVDSQKS